MTPDELGKPRKAQESSARATEDDSKGLVLLCPYRDTCRQSFCVAHGGCDTPSAKIASLKLDIETLTIDLEQTAKDLQPLRDYLQANCTEDEITDQWGENICEVAVELLRKRDARIVELEAELAQTKHALDLAIRQPAPPIIDRLTELTHEVEAWRNKFRAMHRRAQMWEKRARVWSKWRDGVEYWVKKWEYAYSVQSYFFEKYYNERQHSKAMAIAIEMLRAELQAKDKYRECENESPRG